MKTTRKQAIWGAAKAVAAVGLLPLAMQVQALEYQLSEDVKVDLDTTITYGRQWRVEDRSKDIIAGEDPVAALAAGQGTALYKDYVQRMNSDDGSRNFDKGDVVSSRTAAIADLDVSYKNVGVFLRPQVYYDDVPYSQTHWTNKYTPTAADVGYDVITNNGVVGGDAADNSHFTDDYRETLGYKARFLDAYIYGSFPIGDKNLQLRIGRQVISWGEALMLQGGIAFAQNRFDASASTAPGVELKEIFLPTGAVYGQMNVSESDTVEAYWQYEWLPTTLFPTGSYFSMQDMIDGNVFIADPSQPPMRRNSYEPDDNNQWGLAFRHLLGEGTEAALYIVNYTDKSPAFWASNTAAKESSGSSIADPGYVVDPLVYSTNYFDNIRMYGLTLNTVVGGVQVGVEYAYRANTPIVPACTAPDIAAGHCKDASWKQATQSAGLGDLAAAEIVKNVTFSWPDRAEVHTLNIGGTYMLQPTPLWDTATLVGELGGWYIGGFENKDLQFAHLGAFTKYGEGMSMQFMPEYKNVMEGVDVTIPFFMNYGIDGSMSYFNYNEHNLWWSIGAEALYLEHWRFATYYNNYSGQNNLYKDRDNVSLNVKYIF